MALPDGQQRIEWDSIPGATGYILYQADNPDTTNPANWSVLASLDNTTTHYDFQPEHAKKFYYLTYTNEDDFVTVEGGTFFNNDSNVTVPSFMISKYEITQNDYQSVMGSNPSMWYGVGADYPVYMVSWFDAIEYCNRRSIQEGLQPCYTYGTNYVLDPTNPDNWIYSWNQWFNYEPYSSHISVKWCFGANGYRLLTEAEWHYAALGGALTNHYAYSGSDTLDVVSWHSGNAAQSTHPIGLKAPNELGLYDMSGNVLEWTWDIFGDYPSADQYNPKGSNYGTMRSIRGGSWFDDEFWSRIDSRYYNYPTQSDGSTGFRIGKTIPRTDPLQYVRGGTFEPWSDIFVTLSPYLIGRYEVTQAEYMSYINPNPANLNPTGVGDNYPVYNVSWYNAIEFCNLKSLAEGFTPCYTYSGLGTNPADWPYDWELNVFSEDSIACNWAADGYRLPTWMEWLFAYEGGSEGIDYPHGCNYRDRDMGWIYTNSDGLTHPVGQKLPNDLALYDMYGNVSEWLWDREGTVPLGSYTDLNSWQNDEGCWGHRKYIGSTWYSSCDYGTTDWLETAEMSNRVGFRVCRRPGSR